MCELDHWQVVALSRELTAKPIRVEVCGHAIALFRSEPGVVGAVSDVCPHRRMSLAAGRVRSGCIECCYHGWIFDADGNGESPGTPKMHTTTRAYETHEADGLIWLRKQGATGEIPSYDGGPEMNYRLMVQEVHTMEAPIECVLDNFTELEHTPTTHGAFGFQLDRMHEVQLDVRPHEESMSIQYSGPSKAYPWLSRTFMRLSKNTIFNMKGAAHYSPVYVYGDYHWIDEFTGARSPVGIRNVHFFTPIDRQRTRLFTLSYMRLDNPRLYPVLRVAQPFMRRTIVGEVLEDKRVLDGLADKSPSLSGLKLSRFDKVAGIHRDRLAKVYRGEAAAAAE